MCIIRKYEEKDRNRLIKICTGIDGGNLLNADEMQKALMMVFCQYYIEQEPENCFVAVDGQDKAVGYVLCAENFSVWEKNFYNLYLKNTESKLALNMGLGTINGLWNFAEEYPAHLHIDLQEDYQRKGLGTKLMVALEEHLRKEDVPGIMLSVAADNEKGKAFYIKHGMKELFHNGQAVVMGIKLYQGGSKI